MTLWTRLKAGRRPVAGSARSAVAGHGAGADGAPAGWPWVRPRLARRLALVFGILAMGSAAAAAELTVLPDAGVQRIAGPVALARESRPGHAPLTGEFRAHAIDGSILPAGEGALWLRLALHNPTAVTIEQILVIRYPYLDSVEFYATLADGTIRSDVAGARHPVGRTLSPLPAFALDLPPGTSVVHLRFETSGVIAAPLELHAPTAFQRSVLRDHLVIGGVLGAGIVLALYLSFLAGGPRDNRHAAFFALALAALGHVLVMTGIGKVWFWPATGHSTRTLVFIAQGLVVGTGAWYFRTVLQAGGVAPWLNRALLAVSMAGFGTMAAPFLPVALVAGLSLFAAALAPAGLLALALVMWWAGRREAGVLAAGWAPVQAAMLHGYLHGQGLIGFAPVANHLGLAAFALLIGVYARELSREAQFAAVAAECDPLTGLGNRSRLDRGFRTLVSMRGEAGVALFQIDLDRFKGLNDTLGHGAGDEALVEVGRRFTAALRADDLVCRTGGDEFVILLPYSGDPGPLSMIAGRLLAAVQEPVRTSAGEWRLGASIGIAEGEAGADLALLMRSADEALYRVKRAGRNAYRFGEPPSRLGDRRDGGSGNTEKAMA